MYYFFGYVDTRNIAWSIFGCRCFLLPSRHENFGNVVIEALACGCSLIISDKVGVAADLIEYPSVKVLPNEHACGRVQLNQLKLTMLKL